MCRYSTQGRGNKCPLSFFCAGVVHTFIVSILSQASWDSLIYDMKNINNKYEEENEEKMKYNGKYLLGDIIKIVIPKIEKEQKPKYHPSPEYIKKSSPVIAALCQVKGIAKPRGKYETQYYTSLIRMISGDWTDIPAFITSGTKGVTIVSRPLLTLAKKVRDNLEVRNLKIPEIVAPEPGMRLREDFIETYYGSEMTLDTDKFYIKSIDLSMDLGKNSGSIQNPADFGRIPVGVGIYYAIKSDWGTDMTFSDILPIKVTLPVLSAALVDPGILSKSLLCRECVYSCETCSVKDLVEEVIPRNYGKE